MTQKERFKEPSGLERKFFKDNIQTNNLFKKMCAVYFWSDHRQLVDLLSCFFVFTEIHQAPSI